MRTIVTVVLLGFSTVVSGAANLPPRGKMALRAWRALRLGDDAEAATAKRRERERLALLRGARRSERRGALRARSRRLRSLPSPGGRLPAVRLPSVTATSGCGGEAADPAGGNPTTLVPAGRARQDQIRARAAVRCLKRR